MGYKNFVISSGHGLKVRGAKGYFDEVDEARKVVDKVAWFIREMGGNVTTFHDNTSTTQSKNLSTIGSFHNSKQRELDVSIHFNAYKTTTNAMGTETLFYGSNSKKMAVKVNTKLSQYFKSRGAKERTDLYFTANMSKTVPAILIEVCFLDSKADVDKYNAQMRNICKSIAEALMDLTYQEKPSAQPFKIGDFNRTVKVTSDSLNVRKGRGTEHGVIGSLKKGQEVNVSYIHRDNSDGKGNSDLWGSISYKGGVNGMGYIHMDFVGVK